MQDINPVQHPQKHRDRQTNAWIERESHWRATCSESVVWEVGWPAFPYPWPWAVSSRPVRSTAARQFLLLCRGEETYRIWNTHQPDWWKHGRRPGATNISMWFHLQYHTHKHTQEDTSLTMYHYQAPGFEYSNAFIESFTRNILVISAAWQCQSVNQTITVPTGWILHHHKNIFVFVVSFFIPNIGWIAIKFCIDIHCA